MTIQADFEALQVQAEGPQTPVVAREPNRGFTIASGNEGDPATLHSLGGAYSPPGGLADGVDPRVALSRTFKDGPSDAANTITPTVGQVTATDVWLELYENKAKSATYVLMNHRGQVFGTANNLYSFQIPGQVWWYQDF